MAINDENPQHMDNLLFFNKKDSSHLNRAVTVEEKLTDECHVGESSSTHFSSREITCSLQRYHQQSSNESRENESIK